MQKSKETYKNDIGGEKEILFREGRKIELFIALKWLGKTMTLSSLPETGVHLPEVPCSVCNVLVARDHNTLLFKRGNHLVRLAP